MPLTSDMPVMSWAGVRFAITRRKRHSRQSEIYAREGAAIEVSTLADWVGACAASMEPIIARIRAHVFAAERIHADDTSVPILAKGKTTTGRLWTYVHCSRGTVAKVALRMRQEEAAA
jgi:Transposase IS66 family